MFDFLARRAARTLVEEDGWVTMQSIFWTIILLATGGLSVDVAQAWRIQTMLQAAADAATHAAATAMIRNDDSVIDGLDPTEVALQRVKANLDSPQMANIALASDVQFGRWDQETGAFDTDDADPDAVRVTLRRTSNRDNPVPTYFLHFGGLDYWNVSASSTARVFESDRARCEDPILTTRTRVDVENTNLFLGVCIKAQVDAQVAQNGAWIPEHVVGLINSGLLTSLPTNVLNTEVASLTFGGFLGGVVDIITDPLTAILSTEAELSASLADAVAQADAVISLQDLSFADVAANQSLHVTCRADEVLMIPADVALPGVTLFSDCPVKVAQDARISSTIIISNLWSILDAELPNGLPHALALNSRNTCGPGDGVRILVFVDIAAAAQIDVFNIAPLTYVLASAEIGRETHGSGGGNLGLDLEVAGGLLTDLLLEDLGGLCLGANFMLETKAVALAH
ncbi:TadG family pilus assembly protein [Algicella marina]|uniref:DUF2134 domain-containing protein n=1 Tax=Algicella marina TaxID=2683284 RepID=A0A6P1T345_9RHOB|nr:TadG family pilus assembly protein [Algicella marina]QHQ36140.1 hypothetical protein GO499_13670 [Algicella marina]